VLVVLAHPDPESLNEAIAAAAVTAVREAGGNPVLHHLYRDGFDPRLPASEVPMPHTGVPRPAEELTRSGPARERRSVRFADEVAARYAGDLTAADVIVVVHPVWFFHLPAVLKGWVDRVVREDVAFEVGPAGEIIGLLHARSALIVTTANSSPATEAALLGGPLDDYWRTVVFGPAGVREVERLTLSPVRTSEAGTRAAWLAAVARAVARHVGEVV
jgi:putative NADPH-quinone reductase